MLAQEADRFSVEQAIQELRSKKGGTWLSYANTDRQLKKSYEQIRLLAWRLILFVGLIGILNVSNTVYTNIHTRVAEIGMHPTIGMSAGSLYKMFLWGAHYGVVASVIGAAGGYSGHFLHDTVQGFFSNRRLFVCWPLGQVPVCLCCSISVPFSSHFQIFTRTY